MLLNEVIYNSLIPGGKKVINNLRPNSANTMKTKNDARKDEPIVKIIKGSRRHKPKMSPSKKINVYKKEECPDCKKMLTVGNLRYKHARFCIGKKIKESTPISTPVQAVIMKPPPISEREIIRRVDAFNGNNNSNHEPESEVDVVRRYVSNLKKQQEEKMTSQYNNLINSAIVRRNKI